MFRKLLMNFFMRRSKDTSTKNISFFQSFQKEYDEQTGFQHCKINMKKVKEQYNLQSKYSIQQPLSDILHECAPSQRAQEQTSVKSSITEGLKRKKQQGHGMVSRVDPDEALAYGYYFPVGWTEETIRRVLDPRRRDITALQHVRNAFGRPTGTIAVYFRDHATLAKYVTKHNEQFITLNEEVYRVVLKPFAPRNHLTTPNTTLSLKNQVKVTNLDFQVTAPELRRIAQDFGEVVNVDMPLRSNGKNYGMAKVYMKNRIGAKDFTYFIDGFVYGERKLKGQFVQPAIRRKKRANSMKQFKKLFPYTVMNANLKLMERETILKARPSSR